MSMVANIADTLKNVARQQGNKTGLIEAKTGRCLTFRELDNRADRYASFFKARGIKQGNRVMLMVRPSAEFICLTFAFFRLGAPIILIDPGMGYRNLLTCIKGVRPDYLVGVPMAVAFRHLFRDAFSSVKKSFCCGNTCGLAGKDIRQEITRAYEPVSVFRPDERSLAAIIFTTGSTGPPKGVRFEHTIFNTQLDYIRDYYRIGPDDIDQPGFPLFGLFSIALGACAVIPDMDPSRPARVDPKKFVASLDRYGVTYSFGSPAIWNVVSRYCQDKKKKLRTLKKVLMAGAPVPGELIERVFSLMEEPGEIFTPYGATESLPIFSIEGREIVQETWHQTMNGAGTCVGRPLPGIAVRIIRPENHPFASIEDCQQLPQWEIGEIIVSGSVVTRAYENNEKENKYSKIVDSERFWHRIGDVGYLDDKKRLWFCGRKAHRVFSEQGVMYTIPCEAIVNNHPDVFRSALVGIDNENGFEEPVLIIEKNKTCRRDEYRLLQEVRELAAKNKSICHVTHFLIHPGFPVDIRHNAKIFREKLRIWASQQVRS